MKKENFKRILICLVLLTCLIGAVSAVDASTDVIEESSDAVSIDMTSEDIGESVSTASQDLNEVTQTVEQDTSSVIESAGSNDYNCATSTDGPSEGKAAVLSSEASSNALGDGGSTIYVKADGSDENDGSSEATAVASINKALQIASGSDGTDFNIFVFAGDYSSSTINSIEGKNINLIGEDRDSVILRLSGAYGIDVYSENVNWLIENLTICDLVSTASQGTALALFGDGSNLMVNNCVIKNITAKYGAMDFNCNGHATVSNTIIENIYAKTSSAASIYLYDSGIYDFNNVTITGCDLDNDYAASTPAQYLRSIVYVATTSPTVSFSNSRIINNNARAQSIFESWGTLNIVNCIIENNTVKASESGSNGGQYIFRAHQSAGSINISQSSIVNNEISRKGEGIFYTYGSYSSGYGKINAEYSVVYNNTYSDGTDASIRSGSGTTTLDYNYWGSNDAPSGISVNNWVILTAETPEYAFVNVPDAIAFYLNTYNTTSGATGSLEKTVGEVTLDLTYALNNANPSTVTIKDSVGTVDYLATQDGTETVTLSTGDAFSFEVNADVSTLIYVDASAETSGTGTSESPFKTIAEALNIAADGKVIVIRSGTYTESGLEIDDEITVKAERGANVIIDADNDFRIFTVSSTATIKDLTLRNGNSLYGGAILVDEGGDLTLSNVNITDSKAVSGGALANVAGTSLTVISSSFTNNNASSGAAIYVAGSANITESTFTFNGNGGAIYVVGSANIESNVFTANEASNGGAIYIDSENPQTIKGNTFSSNVADHNEAVYIKNAAVDWSRNTLGENEVIYIESGSIKTALTFLGGNTITADFDETVELTATLTDDQGNAIRGGTVIFTANGETIGTVDLSGDSELKTTYTTPASADSDVIISGSYSFDNGGSVVDGTIHLAIPKWFIEGGNGYETLAEAVAAAQAGDVIYGLAGSYTVNGITIDKDITIKANETGTIVLDGGKSKMFTLGTLADLSLVNLTLVNGGSSGGGFADVSSTGTLSLINSTLRDLSASSASACIKVTSGGNVNIEGCLFENITSTAGSAILAATGTSSVITIKDSSFNKIVQSTADHTLMQIGGTLYLERTNFTNVEGKYQSNWYAGVGATSNGNIYATECQFINMTGGDGAAIYFNSGGNINVSKCVFMNTKAYRGAIFVNSPASANINYNLFINNTGDGTNAKALYKNNANANINANYNFWGNNSQPTSSQISNLNGLTYWTIVELSTAADTVYVGTTADIAVKFSATNGEENLTLEDSMPEYSFDLAATEGSIEPATVTIVNNEAAAVFTPPATEGTVTITATPGPSELVLNVMDPSALLVVSADGSDETGLGTLDSPYASIAYALTQVTETRNIIYIKKADEAYEESDLTVAGNVIIRGEDKTVSIDAGMEGRIFTVTGTLTLEDITLTGGMTNDIGGAIYVNGGNLTANNVKFEDCGAGSGGAIGTTPGSNLTVTNSVFDSNMAMYGGAIYAGSEASITDSQFVNHEYSVYGGAIYVNTTDEVIISGNEFNGNDADKGEAIYIENGAVSLSENTFKDAETIYLAGGSVNSVLTFLDAQTINVDFGADVILTATLTDDKGNAIRGGSVTFTANGETVATVDISGENAISTTFTVPADATGDIAISGSYSLDNGGTIANGTLHPAISYWFIEGGSGYETLAQAIAAAQDGDVIYGAPGTYTVNGLAISKSITVKANESGAIVLDGDAHRIFSTNGNVNLINLTFTNGATTGDGGLVLVSGGTLTVNNTVFKDTLMSTSSTHGAAISGAGNINVYDSVFENLSARQGAAIWQSSSSYIINIVGSAFNNINSSYDGGLISSSYSVSIARSNFTNIKGVNTTGEYGNIRVSGGNLNITESIFRNIFGPGGAAVYMTSYSGNLNITKSVFDNVNCTNKGIIYTTSTSYINYNVFLNVNEGVNSSSSGASKVNLDYNYWGSNENPSTLMKTLSPNNWVIMTVTPDTLESVEPGATQAFTVDFTHSTDGTSNSTLADTIPELTVSASAVKGDLDQSEIETVNGIATFTYTASATGEETVTFTNANVAIPVSFLVGDGYFGIVYVSKDGSDENRGDEENPVASIAKAIEIAQAGSGQIIINEGTYNEYNLTISSDLEISTVGEVIWDANGGRAFAMTAGDVSISNITFINGNSSYAGQLISVTGGSLAIDGSKFTNNGGPANTSGVIRVSNADLDLTNCVIDDNVGGLGNSYGFVYSDASTLKVDNCNFTNNFFKYGPIYITAGSIAVINNSEFISNTARATSGGSGGALYIGATAAKPTLVLIENSKFINNSATGSTYNAGEGGAIYLNNNVDATVVNCVFENNTCTDNTDGSVAGRGGAITTSGCNLTVFGSIFENNLAQNGSAINLKYNKYAGSIGFLNISNSIILTADDTKLIATDNTNGTFIANSNWWGTSNDPSNKVSELITVDNWVIMNIDPTETTGFTGEAVEILVDFKYIIDAENTISALEGGLPRELTVNAYSANGTLDKTTVETTNLEAKFKFTPEFAGENIVRIYTTESDSQLVTIMVSEKYAGPIYVSKDGDDSNEGSEENPVASIAKAIELAQGKSGQIIIGEGTYVESDLTISDDLNITSIGEVIWDANGQRAFSMATGDVSIANVTFKNGNSTSYGHLIRVDGDRITFEGCKFISNGGNVSGTNGVIYVNMASANFTDCHFENNTAGTGTSYGLISTKDSVLIVDACTFVNNFNKNGCIYVSGSSIGSVAIINNTKFIGNNASSASGGSGGAIYASGSMAYQYSNGTVRPGAQSTVYVLDCDFIDNTAYGGTYYNAEGGAIFVNANSTLYVSNSRFINNSALDNNAGDKLGRGGAIAATTGNVQITNSIFEGNVASNGSAISMKFANKDLTTVNILDIHNSVIMGSGEKLIASDFTNGSLIANNNWWASNDNPSDKVSEGITVDSWVILTADPSEVTANVGVPVAITANFRHTNSTDGVIAELEGAFPELEVYGYAFDGEITESNGTEENVATLYYTPEEAGETTVYAVAGNAMVPIQVTVSDAPQPVTDIIYVSPSGNDDNPGTSEAPVATIAKAVELAKVGTGVIVIKEGTYNENGITIDSAMSITGEGNVVIDGTGLDPASIFTIETGEDVSISNIKFANNTAPNGGAIAVYPNDYSISTVNVTIDNCSFDNLEAKNITQYQAASGGAIYAGYVNGNLVVKNSNFTANNAKSWGGAIDIGYSAYEDGLNLEIDNCIFENNTANNAGALYLMARNITIKNSIVNNNSATYSPGAIYMINTTAHIDNCTITNNSARDEVSAIEIHGGNIQYNPTLVNPSNVEITNCVIENNYGREGTAPAIQMQNSNMNASYCSIVNEFNLENTVTATYGDEKPGLVLLNNIWWGTDDPTSKINGTNFTVEKWVIMNVVANATNVSAGDIVKVTVDFNHVIDADGTITEITGGTIPKTYTVTLTAENGTLSTDSLVIAQGESQEFTFTADAADALITLSSENAIEKIVFTGDTPEPFTGIVYVSKDGDDANEGSSDEPVATLARAIEIATADGGSGQIVIREGRYSGNGYNITKNLVITGEGDVILDALSEGNKLFNIGYGSGVANFELHNLVLENLRSNYGAAVYSYAENLVLDNITITDVDSETSRLITSNGNLTVKDSVFANNTVSGLISHGGNGKNITIINTLIEGNNVTYDQSIFGVVYVSANKGNIVIEDSKFYDNLVRQSTVRGNSETDITVKNSEFINNTADNSPYYSSGGAIYALAKLDVSESIFINNQARRDGGAIYIGSNGQASITKSEFINNTVYDTEYLGDAIYTKGTTEINYCIFLTNGTRYAVYNDGSNAANAQYNWWGSNDSPASLVNNADVSNWIVMNVVADTSDVEAGSEMPITVDFNHYLDANGDIQELADSLAQELTVEFSAISGSLDKETAQTVDQVASATYTVASGSNNVTVKSSDAEISIVFESGAGPAETELNADAVTVTVGSGSLDVSLSSNGAPLSGKTISVKFTDDITLTAVTNESGIASIDLSSLPADTYNAEISFAGDEDYAASNANVAVTVNKAASSMTLEQNGREVIVNLTSDGAPIAGKTVSTIINGQNVTATTDENGIAKLDISALSPGSQSITVSFSDDTYADASETITLDVPKYETSLDASDLTVILGSGTLEVTLLSEGSPIAGESISASIGGANLTATTDDNGVAKFDLSSIPLGTHDVAIKFAGDDTYDESSADIKLTVKEAPKTAEELQKLIDETPAGGVLDLSNTEFADISDINITKDITIKGDNTTITTAGDGKPVFNVASNVNKVNINGVDFKVNNGDTLVKATATNGTSPTSIKTPAISISNNTVSKANDDVVPKSVTILELESERGTLAPTNSISVSGNTMDSGVNPFEFTVSSVQNGSNINIPDNINPTPVRKASVIVYQNMTTTAVATVDGRVGKYFTITLKDKASGKALANKKVQIGFNGKVYDRTTDSKGQAKLQINLGYEGLYTFAVCFLGDDEYNASFVVAKIKVNAQKPKLTTAKKTYKVKAKTKTLTATFKAASGKVVKGKKITFTVNGKTYTATTNAKGIAKVKVSISKKGTYAFTAKFAGDGMFKATSVKNKLIIK